MKFESMVHEQIYPFARSLERNLLLTFLTVLIFLFRCFIFLCISIIFTAAIQNEYTRTTVLILANILKRILDIITRGVLKSF